MPCAQRNPCVFICYTVISTAISKKKKKTLRSIRCDQQLRKTLQIGHHIQTKWSETDWVKTATKPSDWESLESKVPWWRWEETRAELCDGS